MVLQDQRVPDIFPCYHYICQLVIPLAITASAEKMCERILHVVIVEKSLVFLTSQNPTCKGEVDLKCFVYTTHPCNHLCVVQCEFDLALVLTLTHRSGFVIWLVVWFKYCFWLAWLWEYGYGDIYI